MVYLFQNTMAYHAFTMVYFHKGSILHENHEVPEKNLGFAPNKSYPAYPREAPRV